jgi:Tol biopolymer transport system component
LTEMGHSAFGLLRTLGYTHIALPDKEGENHMARRTLYLPVMIAAVVACAVAILAISQKAEAAFPGKNGRIAFEGYRDTGTGGSSAEIITVSPDGTGTKQLTSASGSGNPTFSPDGEKIAYAASYEAGTRGIYVMNRSGNDKKALTNSNNLPEYGPTWSPDGKKIAFVRQERVSTPEGQSDWQVDVWVMNADGSEQKKLTDDFNHEGTPTWSPDGTEIAFVDGPDIWTVKPDGSGRHNLTNTPNIGEEDPDFSPDGKKLAFASRGQYKKPDIYTMRLDGSDLTNVTDSRYVGEEDCVWSPSGTAIAYRKDFPENAEIFKKNADGSGRSKNASNDPKYNSSPDWAPKLTTATG